MAAAGLVALDYLPRLAEDHAKARRLADGLRAMGFTVPAPQTNILLVPVPDAGAAVLHPGGGQGAGAAGGRRPCASSPTGTWPTRTWTRPSTASGPSPDAW